MVKGYAFLLAAGLLVTSAKAQTAAPEAKPLLGFEPAHAATEYQLETKFDAQLRADNLREWMKRMAAHPHHVGSPYDKDNADFIAGLFRSWGYETRIDVSYVLFPTPKLRVLELVAPTRYVAGLTEKPVAEDATSGQTAEQLPIYNCYSRDGDVTVAGQFWQMVAAGFVVMAAYGVIGVAVGALVRNQIAAVVGVLVWMNVVEQIVVNSFPAVGRWMPGGATDALLQLGHTINLDGKLLSASVAGLVLVGYTAAAVALALLVTPRRDVL